MFAPLWLYYSDALSTVVLPISLFLNDPFQA